MQTVFTYLHVKKEVVVQLREALLKDTYWHSLLKPYNVQNSPSEIVDEAIATRRNGLILVGLNKPLFTGNSPCSAHYIFLAGGWNGVYLTDPEPLEYGWQGASRKNSFLYRDIVTDMY